MGRLMDNYDSNNLSKFIFQYLKKNLEPQVLDFFDSKQKTHGLIDSMEYQEYRSRIILKDTQATEWFLKKYPYQPRPDISIIPTVLVNWQPSHKEGYFAPIHAAKETLRIPAMKSLVNSIYRMSDNYQHVKRSPVNPDIIIDRKFDLEFNATPQFLISFELEKSNHMKYVLGSAFNASITGKIGILIYDHRNYCSVKGLYEIIRARKFLQNVLFISHRNFLHSIRYSD